MPGLFETITQVENNIAKFKEKTEQILIELHKTLILSDIKEVYYIFEMKRNLFSIEMVMVKRDGNYYIQRNKPILIVENEEFLSNILYTHFWKLQHEYGTIVEGILFTKFTKWFLDCWISAIQEVEMPYPCYFIWMHKKELYDLKKQKWVI